MRINNLDFDSVIIKARRANASLDAKTNSSLSSPLRPLVIRKTLQAGNLGKAKVKTSLRTRQV